MLFKSNLLFCFFISTLMVSCQQNGSGKNSNAITYNSKLNISYERYYLRKAKCDIAQSDYVQEATHKIENILTKVEKKAISSGANWVVITGLGEGAVSDHYFYEAYNCDGNKNQQVISDLGEVKHNLKFVQTDIQRLDDSLVKRHYPTFKLYMRSKLGQ